VTRTSSLRPVDAFFKQIRAGPRSAGVSGASLGSASRSTRLQRLHQGWRQGRRRLAIRHTASWENFKPARYAAEGVGCEFLGRPVAISLSTWFRDYLHIPAGRQTGAGDFAYFNLVSRCCMRDVAAGGRQTGRLPLGAALHGTLLKSFESACQSAARGAPHTATAATRGLTLIFGFSALGCPFPAAGHRGGRFESLTRRLGPMGGWEWHGPLGFVIGALSLIDRRGTSTT